MTTGLEPPADDDDPFPLVPVPVGGGAAPEGPEPVLVGARPEQYAEAFSCFYREFVARLVAYIVHQGASMDLAADIVQDTMIKAYRKWPEIECHKAWAYKVAYREYLRHVMRVVEAPVAEISEPTPLLPCPEEAEAWAQEQEIVRVVRGLPGRQRQVFALFLDGWTPAEIAGLLGIEGPAVRSSLRKARVAVGAELRRGEGDENGEIGEGEA